MEKMSVGGFNIDADSIGRGAYELFSDHDKTVVAYGMMPAKKMEVIERQVRERLGVLAAERLCSPELAEGLSKAIEQSAINEVMHKVTVAILGAASDAGKLLV